MSKPTFVNSCKIYRIHERVNVAMAFVKPNCYTLAMRLSHETRVKNIEPSNGYGYATDRMITSLRRLGHQIEPNDHEAPVGIWFDQPHHWKWNSKDQYKIGYHPWESTKLKDGWVKEMNKCDEIWTPSPLIADWYREDGVKPPVYVYEHGVDKIWTPKKREVEDDGIIRFLHCGGEAARKRADRTMQAFRVAFADRTDVKLTLKMISPGWNVPMRGKISVVNQRLDITELVDLFHNHHIYLYPSHGEGFGLTPLQAIATGMPTITVPAWAPYSKFLDEDLSIPSELKNSPWGQTHPGKMFRPDFDAMVDAMRYAADNYEVVRDTALTKTDEISKAYDWDSITKETFDNLENRIK